jgi:hypothetical protein
MRRASAHGLCSIVAPDDANIHLTRERQPQWVPSSPTCQFSLPNWTGLADRDVGISKDIA